MVEYTDVSGGGDPNVSSFEAPVAQDSGNVLFNQVSEESVQVYGDSLFDKIKENALYFWIGGGLLFCVLLIGLFFLIDFSDGISEESLEVGESIAFERGKIVSFEIENEDHFIEVESFDDSSVDVVVHSNVFRATLEIGDSAVFDLNEDGVLDFSVKFERFVAGEPILFVKKFNATEDEEDSNFDNEKDPSAEEDLSNERGEVFVEGCVDTDDTDFSMNSDGEVFFNPGEDVYTAGHLIVDGVEMGYDICKDFSSGSGVEGDSGTHLREFACLDGGFASPEDYECPNGCRDGACLPDDSDEDVDDDFDEGAEIIFESDFSSSDFDFDIIFDKEEYEAGADSLNGNFSVEYSGDDEGEVLFMIDYKNDDAHWVEPIVFSTVSELVEGVVYSEGIFGFAISGDFGDGVFYSGVEFSSSGVYSYELLTYDCKNVFDLTGKTCSEIFDTPISSGFYDYVADVFEELSPVAHFSNSVEVVDSVLSEQDVAFYNDFENCEDSGNVLTYQSDFLFQEGDIFEFSVVGYNETDCIVRLELISSENSQFEGNYSECGYDNTIPDEYWTDSSYLANYIFYDPEYCDQGFLQYAEFLYA